MRAYGTRRKAAGVKRTYGDSSAAFFRQRTKETRTNSPSVLALIPSPPFPSAHARCAARHPGWPHGDSRRGGDRARSAFFPAL